MLIAFLISLVAAYPLPATPAAPTCGRWLDAATARDRGRWVEINCETLPCPCLPPDPRADGGGGRGGGSGGDDNDRDANRSQRIRARITEVTDGDTLKVRAYRARRKRYDVRLIGIDTPETKRPGVAVECGGPEATSSMIHLAMRRRQDTDGDGLYDDGSRGRRVILRTDPSQDVFDRYDRLLAYVKLRGGPWLAQRQLRRGWAEVYVYGGDPFRQVNSFRRAERSARRADRGVWSLCDGDFHSEQD